MWPSSAVSIGVNCAARFSNGQNYIHMHYADTIANDGRVEQRNFDGYSPPYMKDAPAAVDVHIVPSGDKPTGCGEPPVPVIAPASTRCSG